MTLFWLSEKSNWPHRLSLLSLRSSACSHRQTSPSVLFSAKPRKCFSQHCIEDVLWEVLALTIWQEWGLSVWGPHSWQWKYDVVSRCIWAQTSLLSSLSFWSVVKPRYPTESFILQPSLPPLLSFSDTVQKTTRNNTSPLISTSAGLVLPASSLSSSPVNKSQSTWESACVHDMGGGHWK